LGKVNSWLKRGPVAVLLSAVSSFAFAATAVGQATPVEQYLMSKGVKISAAFPSASGLKAIVADSGKERRLFYVTPDGKSLISGTVFDATGNSVTAVDMGRGGIDTAAATAPQVPGSQAKALWDRAEQLSWISEGKAGAKTIYVLFDPNCPYCHRLWTTLRTAVNNGKIQVRWLPVAILKDDSKALGAAIYASKEPSKAMAQMVEHQLAPAPVSDAVNKRIAYNLLLLKDTGYTGVPTILYQQGGQYRVSMGVPNDREIAAIIP